MLCAALLVAVLGAAPVELLPRERLQLLPRPDLLAHLHDVDDELRELRRFVSAGDVFQAAAERATPFVAVTGAPTLALALLAGTFNARLPDEAWLATGLVFAAGLAAGLFYCVGRVFELVLVDRPDRAAREDRLLEYRPGVVQALEAAPPPASPGG